MVIFIDTGYILALINTSDEYHERASAITSEIVGRFVITEAVLTEIGNTLSRLRWRSTSVATIEDLRSDPDIEVVSISPELFDRAVKLYSSRRDKEWGLTDCISFVVMQGMEIVDALTTDDHFRQAGFRALLIE
ncbi:MAG: PIN domain-containing protein [Candidatus Methanogaster sp.]|uniref:PIN domain-containing protein n=1 Tax=Candidatus Methanogaster sp. TaxID=3386292 RepID=A0AC61L208_9EURY|nr:MAG: PIN domain-containing protein [ANME-2 cluster archaeon]